MPAYLCCILFNWKLLQFVGNDSDFYPLINDVTTSCDGIVYRNILLIENFWDKETCFGWGWYLACDF